jgi:hypothetical protein
MRDVDVGWVMFYWMFRSFDLERVKNGAKVDFVSRVCDS